MARRILQMSLFVISMLLGLKVHRRLDIPGCERHDGVLLVVVAGELW